MNKIETVIHTDAFKLYKKMGGMTPEFLVAFKKECGKSETTAYRWARDFHWRERAKEFTPRKGRAYVVTTGTNGGVMNVMPEEKFKTELAKAQISKGDQQLEDEKKWAGEKLAPHPFSTASFDFMHEHNVIFMACVGQVAIDVAGLGHVLKLREGMSEDLAQLKKITELIKEPNKLDMSAPTTRPTMSFRHLNRNFVNDWGIEGNSAFQIVRNAKGEVSEVWYMPTLNLFAAIDGKRFAQKRGTKAVWFARYHGHAKPGELLVLDPKTGDPAPGLSLEARANEIIHHHGSYRKSKWYGVPNILPVTADVLTGFGIRDYNLAFFVNFGQPAYIVKLEGDWEDGSTEGEDDSVEIIREHFNNHLKGADKCHSTLVIAIPTDGTMTIEPLDVQIKEGSFRLMKQDITQDILTAYKIPPYRVAIPVKSGSIGNDSMPEKMLEVYVNGTVEPWQRDLEELWSDLIFDQGLKCPNYEIKFTNIKTGDDERKSVINDRLFRTGQMTANQGLVRDGRPEDVYPEGDTYYVESGLLAVGEAIEE